jgi:protein TonB
MKTAIMLSLAFHVIVGAVWSLVVKITHVTFVPRQVYTVNIVTAAELPKPPQKKAPEVVEQEPEPKPKPEPPKEEDVAPPVEPKPKPKKEEPKPKEVNKTTPKTETPSEPAEPDDTAEEPVTTGDISLDEQDFEFAYYITSMRRKIAAFWQAPQGSTEERYCVVYFRIQRNGTIMSPSIETSSGNLVFDQAALRAVYQASPLPALPPAYSENELGVHFSFAYTRE